MKRNLRIAGHVVVLWESPVGYVNDITKFVIERQ
jgi:hypothetical protein